MCTSLQGLLSGVCCKYGDLTMIKGQGKIQTDREKRSLVQCKLFFNRWLITRGLSKKCLQQKSIAVCFHNCGESVLWRSKKPLVETETLLIKIVFDYITLISWHLKETITIRYLNAIFHEFSKRNSTPFPTKSEG